MTNAELIEMLKTMPMNAELVVTVLTDATCGEAEITEVSLTENGSVELMVDCI